MSAELYIEGGARGADSNESRSRCRKGFCKLLEKCGFAGRMPRLNACGSREEAFKNFKTALRSKGQSGFVAMWIDSEEPLKDVDQTWLHLKNCDGWDPPAGVNNEQVLFMTTCMETLIVADHAALDGHYRSLQKSALPPLTDLEQRKRNEVQEKLMRATRNCKNPYEKGDRSFEILAKLDPSALDKLPSFARTRRILSEKLT